MGFANLYCIIHRNKGKDKGGKAVCGPRRKNPPHPFGVGVGGKLPIADTKELMSPFLFLLLKLKVK